MSHQTRRLDVWECRAVEFAGRACALSEGEVRKCMVPRLVTQREYSADEVVVQLDEKRKLIGYASRQVACATYTFPLDATVSSGRGRARCERTLHMRRTDMTRHFAFESSRADVQAVRRKDGGRRKCPCWLKGGKAGSRRAQDLSRPRRNAIDILRAWAETPGCVCLGKRSLSRRILT